MCCITSSKKFGVSIALLAVLGLFATANAVLDPLSCLERTGGTYNIGCPGHTLCFEEGVNGSSPYDLLCDGIQQCNPAVDEGTLIGFNQLVDCE